MSVLPRKGSRWDNQRSKHNWKGAAEMARLNPCEWVLASQNVSSGVAQNVRSGRVLPLRDLGGKIEATIRNSNLVTASRYGDLYIRWTPQEVLDQEESESA